MSSASAPFALDGVGAAAPPPFNTPEALTVGHEISESCSTQTKVGRRVYMKDDRGERSEREPDRSCRKARAQSRAASRKGVSRGSFIRSPQVAWSLLTDGLRLRITRRASPW